MIGARHSGARRALPYVEHEKGRGGHKGKRMSVDVANAMGTSDVELLRENVAETVPNCGGSRKIFLPEPAWRAASSEIFRRHPMPSSST